MAGTNKKPKGQASVKVSSNVELSEVSVSYGMTLNIGNYESFRADAACTVRLKKDCDIPFEDAKEELFDQAWKVAKEELISQVKAVREQVKNKS